MLGCLISRYFVKKKKNVKDIEKLTCHNLSPLMLHKIQQKSRQTGGDQTQILNLDQIQL